MGIVKNLMVRCGADFSALTAATAKANHSIKSMQGTVNTSTKAMTQNIGGVVSAFGKIAIAMYAARELYRFGSACISAASDLQEVQNVVDVTFGSMSYKVEEFAATSVKSFGLTETAAKKYTGYFGAMLKSSGLATSKAADMSIELTKLAADIASFYNLDFEEAYSKISSGLAGEIKPLRAIGISMTVANMEAYALTKGITKSYEAMNQAEQIALRYSYLMQTTADAQGDFARTSGNWANQTKLLGQNFVQLKANIGAVLMQAVLPLIQGLNALLSAAVSVSGSIARLFRNTTNSAKGAVIDLADVGGVAEETAASAAAAGGGGGGNTLASFDKINVLSSGGGGGAVSEAEEIANAEAKAEAAGGEATSKLQKYLDSLKGFFQPIVNAWSSLKESLGHLQSAFSDLWNSPEFTQIREFFGSAVKEMISNTLAVIRNLIAGGIYVLSGAISGAAGAIKIFVGLVNGDWSMALEGIKLLFEGLGDVLYGVLVVVLGEEGANAVKNFCSNTAKAFSDWWTNKVAPWFTVKQWSDLWNNVKIAFSTKWEEIKTWWNNTAIKKWWDEDVVKWFKKETWVDIMKGVKEGFEISFKNAVNGAIALFNRFITWVNDNMKFSWDALTIAGKTIVQSGSIQLFRIPSIPALATGGIVDGPTRALIGESGAEAVLPLENNTQWMDRLAERIGGDIIIQANGNWGQLVRMLGLEISKDNRRSGRSRSLVAGGAVT